MYDDYDNDRENPANVSIAGGAAAALTVTELNARAKRLLEHSFKDIWIQGEISRPTIAASGHAYFTLKDDKSSISCACFRSQLAASQCQPEAGIQVLARGRVSLYPAQGRYQFVVSFMEDAGAGALQRKFEELKKKLSAEGLFDEQQKKPLPLLPARVGIITSPTGAVVHDIIATFKKRFPAIALRVYPVSVQGNNAVAEIVAALHLANLRQDCDALILARGGGSLEDLMAFNDEAVARAVFASDLPVVCGVGHEPDVSIADYVADRRAATPTAAAEALSPNREEWLGYYRSYQARIVALLRDRIESRAQRIDLTRKRLVHPKTRLTRHTLQLNEQRQRLRRSVNRHIDTQRMALASRGKRLQSTSPRERLQRQQQQLARANTDLERLLGASIERRSVRLDHAVARLRTVSPSATLDRGYAILEREDGTPDQRIVRDAASVQKGERLRARVSRGQIVLVVDSNEP